MLEIGHLRDQFRAGRALLLCLGGRSSGVALQSRHEDDLPGDVTGLELRERSSNVPERVGPLDRHDEVARRDQLGQFAFVLDLHA